MDTKRKLAMVVATVAVALGAGHLMQNGMSVKPGRVAVADASSKSAATPAAATPAETPKQITPLAAGLGTPSVPSGLEPAAPALPDTAFAPAAPSEAMPSDGAQNDEALAQDGVPQPMEPEATDTPQAGLSDTVIQEPAAPEFALSGDTTTCPVVLDVMASAQATLDLTLTAPCRASERVVIRHGGLAVTAMTSLTGALFTSLPGMEPSGEVTVLFGDGVVAQAAESLPDLPLYRRFAVQWMADDAFQINAFENGAGFGEAGHVSAANPQRRLPNVPMQGGYLSLLGDSTTPLPMQAEVYTFPLDPAAPVDLSIEASVTAATCDRELLGEVLLSEGGVLTKTDLTMATPTCDAIGDVLVLNNPLPDLKLAAVN